ncbi:MAG: histidine--tRNA ligase [Candidatus Brachytrichaceae bacterium NZ_4S206]|jgi:histidyl-tRNA synthetase
MPIVTPKPMSGFPELLPEQQLVFNRCLDVIRRTFERYGFTPIETPAVERKEVLTSKGGNEKEIYALSRLSAGPGESAETEFALHFDLTVPLARYVAQHKDKLTFPFRRYQIQKVWRGERPQSGRYRELYQCDIDVIGRGSVSLMTDAEIPSVIYHVFREMDIGRFVVRINNRRLLQGFFDAAGVPAERKVEVLRTVDALEKIGRDAVAHALVNKVGLGETTTGHILDFLDSSRGVLADDVLRTLHAQVESGQINNEDFARGVYELQTVVEGMRSLGVPDDYFEVDLSIARGLDYYTGTVYETRLVAHPDLGSICSGGRYDDLASYFTNEKLPGVGISIGLSRLVLRLLDAGVLKPGPATPALVLVTTMDAGRMQDYLRIGAELRARGIATEVYLEKARLGDQLKYANRKGFRFAVIAGEAEFAAGQIKVKNLATASEQALPRDEAVAALAGMVQA